MCHDSRTIGELLERYQKLCQELTSLWIEIHAPPVQGTWTIFFFKYRLDSVLWLECQVLTLFFRLFVHRYQESQLHNRTWSFSWSNIVVKFFVVIHRKEYSNWLAREQARYQIFPKQLTRHMVHIVLYLVCNNSTIYVSFDNKLFL